MSNQMLNFWSQENVRATNGSSPNFASNIKGTVILTEIALINNHLRVSKVS